MQSTPATMEIPSGADLTGATVAERVNIPVLLLALSSVLYNAILAYVNHNIMPLTLTPVAGCEAVIMVSCIAYMLYKGLYEPDLAPLLFLVFTFLIVIYEAVFTGIFLIDHFRNILIIFCFAGLGTWANERTVKLAFRIGTLAVLIFLICEIVNVTLYVSLFHPSDYFENTRGLKPLSFNKTGLFQNALGFASRFSFGLIDHRSASIFLEQVSLANYSGVLAIYLISLWKSLSLFDRLLAMATIVLILLTNDTRTMLIFSAVCIAGYFVFPLIPKYFSLMIMPFILFAGFFVYLLEPDASGDNFSGRITLTIRRFFELDIPSSIGLSISRLSEFGDSGYIYVIYCGTIFGLIALWLFVSLYPGGVSSAQRRCCHSLSLFLFLNMMIGGNAIFSMKIAGLLWFLVGYMRFRDIPRVGQAASST